MKYICDNCERTFEVPFRVHIIDVPEQEIEKDVCPHCGYDIIEELDHCELCGCDLVGDTLCNDCKARLVDDIDKLRHKYALKNDDEVIEFLETAITRF